MKVLLSLFFVVCFSATFISAQEQAASSSSFNRELLDLTCREICQQIRTGDLTSTEVVETLHQQYLKQHSQINALVINLFDEALETAKAYDIRAKQNDFVGPLHGLPISIKENIDIKGIAGNLGINDPRIQPATSDADIVKILKSLGAIIIGKTNVPQALIPMDCNSEYGQTYNPWNRDFVTGGSSGGEAALIASGQSFAGMGTDLGGSIRFPAGFCGVAGFKPTNGSLPHYGVQTAVKGQNIVSSSIGPLARHVDDIIFLLEHIYTEISEQEYLAKGATSIVDVSIPPYDFKTHSTTTDVSKMRIGYYKYDGFIKPAPALVKAVEESIEILKEQGAELIEIPCPNQKELIKSYVGAVSADGQKMLMDKFKYQKKPVQQLKGVFQLAKLSNFGIRLIASILKTSNQERFSEFLLAVRKKSVHDYWLISHKVKQFRMEEMNLWEEQKLDAVICPATALTSVKRGIETDISLIFSYYGRYNMFGFPAGVVPMRFVQDDELKYTDDVNDKLTERMAQSTKESLGMPTAVQVVALPWQDHKALAVMKSLEENRKAVFEYPY